MRSWKTPKKFYKAMRKDGWKGELRPLDTRRWHNSLSTQANVVMSNEWFEEKGLTNLIIIRNDYHPKGMVVEEQDAMTRTSGSVRGAFIMNAPTLFKK